MKRSIITECVKLALVKHSPSHPSWEFKSKHYSFVIQNNKILEMGMNRPEVAPPIYYGYPKGAGIHSEIDAWRKARGLLGDDPWEMVNIRLLRTKPYKMANSSPCKHCAEILAHNGCKNVYFSTDSGWFAKLA